jgi:uncharacterized membrane protein YsdA (DUF1294 family)
LVTAWDKRCARRREWRVPENTLFFIAFVGGAAAMLLTMLLVRHKTRHARFMVGLPLVLAVQAVAIFAWLQFT